MLVKDIMSKRPDFLPPTATLKEASLEMKKNDFGFLPIGENDRLIGTVTDRDITIRAVAAGKDPNKTLVKDILTEKVLYCFEEDNVEKAVASMGKQHVRRLIVLNKNKHMTGILSLSDLATKCKNPLLWTEALKEISEKLH